MNDLPWKKSVKQVLKVFAEALSEEVQTVWGDCQGKLTLDLKQMESGSVQLRLQEAG